jgi:hypothetical protein
MFFLVFTYVFGNFKFSIQQKRNWYSHAPHNRYLSLTHSHTHPLSSPHPLLVTLRDCLGREALGVAGEHGRLADVPEV